LSLPQTEWDFSRVPRLELAACIYYEYARESPTIRGLAEKYFTLKREHDREAEAKFQSRFSESLSPRAKRNELPPAWKKELEERKMSFIDNFVFYSHEIHRPSGRMPGPDSAEKLLSDWRFALPVFAGSEFGRIVLGSVDFPNKPWTSTDESARKAAINQAALVARKLVEHYPWRAGSWPSSGREFDNEGETLVMHISWRQGTTEQIVRDFRKWATKYRKEYCRNMPPPRGQRITVTKAWLKRLAEMRLWKAGGGFVGAQRIQNEPVAAEEREAREQGIQYAPRDEQLKEPISQNASDKKVRGDITRVTTDMRKLFGLLIPPDETPLSYPFPGKRRFTP